jgi:hypothetical protein
MGCVQSPEQAQALERVIGLVDDVMGTRETPRYRLAP